jgi:hypothetical protein
MRTGKRNRVYGHVWACVIVGIVAIACGLVIGFLGRNTSVLGPSSLSGQTIADGLSSPLPVPSNAKLVKVFGPDVGSGSDLGKSGQVDPDKGRLRWHTILVLDVTGVKPDQVQAIPAFYESYLNKGFPGQFPREYDWITEGIGTRGVSRFPKGHAPPDGWIIASGVKWTWGIRGHAVNQHLFCEVNTEVNDFVDDPRQGSWDCRGVSLLTDPVKGQRVMYVELTVDGHDLRNVGRDRKSVV